MMTSTFQNKSETLWTKKFQTYSFTDLHRKLFEVFFIILCRKTAKGITILVRPWRHQQVPDCPRPASPGASPHPLPMGLGHHFSSAQACQGWPDLHSTCAPPQPFPCCPGMLMGLPRLNLGPHLSPCIHLMSPVTVHSLALLAASGHSGMGLQGKVLALQTPLLPILVPSTAIPHCTLTVLASSLGQ